MKVKKWLGVVSSFIGGLWLWYGCAAWAANMVVVVPIGGACVGDALPTDVRQGKKFSSSGGENLVGVLPMPSPLPLHRTHSIKASREKTVVAAKSEQSGKGQYGGRSVIVIPILHSCPGDAGPEDVLLGKIFSSRQGRGLVGTMLVGIPPWIWVCGETLTDSRDGMTYKTVKIGDQCWMAENLRVGVVIPRNNRTYCNNIPEMYCYGDSVSYCDTYGGLYNWYEAMDCATDGSDTDPSGIKGICPEGWHIPSDLEWKKLEMFLGATAGSQLRSTAGWYDGNNGSNASGFDAKPAGWTGPYGSFQGLGREAVFWTSSDNGGLSYAYAHGFGYDNRVYRVQTDDTEGLSVRCVKD